MRALHEENGEGKHAIQPPSSISLPVSPRGDHSTIPSISVLYSLSSRGASSRSLHKHRSPTGAINSRSICYINRQPAKDSTLHRFSCSASLRHRLVTTLQRFIHKEREAALTHPKPVHTNFQSRILMNDVTKHWRFLFFYFFFLIFLFPPLTEIKNDIKWITWLLHFY